MSVGMSLVELLVVMTIIAILTAAFATSFTKESQQKRDIQRQSDLRNLQVAIELYKNKNGRYPEGCNTPGNWSGELGSSYKCGNNTSQYIKNLAPEFIPVLPTDPKLNCPSSGSCNKGYVYTVNADGSVYKLMAKNTVEAEPDSDNLNGKGVDWDHPFKSCEISDDSQSYCTGSLSGNTPPHCQESNDQFKTSYGVWGGYAIPDVVPGHPQYENKIKTGTRAIICNIP